MDATDGGVFSFSLPFLGSMGGQPMASPVLGMATDPTDRRLLGGGRRRRGLQLRRPLPRQRRLGRDRRPHHRPGEGVGGNPGPLRRAGPATGRGWPVPSPQPRVGQRRGRASSEQHGQAARPARPAPPSSRRLASGTVHPAHLVDLGERLDRARVRGPLHLGRGCSRGRSVSRSPSAAQASTCFPPRWTISPSARRAPGGAGAPTSSANSRSAAARGSPASPGSSSPLGIVQVPSPRLVAQTGPPGWTIRTSVPVGPPVR